MKALIGIRVLDLTVPRRTPGPRPARTENGLYVVDARAGQAACRPPASRGEGAEGTAFVRPMRLAVGIHAHGGLAIGVYPEGGTVIRMFER
jgi:hypothetical protein